MFFTLALLSTLSAPSTPVCETYAPRLDGSVVTVCSGKVTSVRMATPAEFNAWRNSQTGEVK
jgi:hypothetical protein